MKCFELRMEYSSCPQQISQASHAGLTRARHVISQDGKSHLTYLASGINDLRGIFLPLVLNDFTECIFDSRVVTLHKVSIDKLHSEGRFACGISALERTYDYSRSLMREGGFKHTD